MAKTKYTEVVTVGPIEWARVFEANRDMDGYEGSYTDCEGAYTVNQIIDKDQYEKLKIAGSQKKPIQKRLMEGEMVIKFERKHKVTTSDGTVIEKASGAPDVVKEDGSKWSEDDGLIGNGSVAEITNLITVFMGQDGKQYGRTTLIKIKVLEHKVFAPDNEEAAA
jgi:hypothetical protein|tara:strand:+ start:4260 stop:4754 length:495 start_codon:yes stop_codon:yes gene_type:complete